LKIGIVTRNTESWGSIQLRKALDKKRISHECFPFPKIVAQLSHKPSFTINNSDIIEEFKALVIRPIGRGSVHELVFRMDMLSKMEKLGLIVINPSKAIEHCADKYAILSIMENSRIPIPRTIATESVSDALRAFDELGGDVIIKPIFGSRGIGTTRIVDSEIASTTFKAIVFHHGVIYLQEFIPHGTSDIRAFVIGNQVIASMRRVSKTWKNNYSQGAHPAKVKLSSTLKELAIKSAKAVGCKIAGVDILEGPKGPMIVDVNSQPGWKGLQIVSQHNIADEIVSFVLSEIKK
jgi:RimK family alpha-L-glutamate ligase